MIYWSVAVNTAPEDFALDDQDLSCGTVVLVATLYNVHWLAIVVGKREEVESSESSGKEEEELRELELRLEKLIGTSMDERDFLQKVMDLRKMEVRIEVTSDHVTRINSRHLLKRVRGSN